MAATMARSKKKGRLPSIGRDAALKARPVKLPFLFRKEVDNDKLQITVRLQRPWWLRMMGGGETFERTYSLDRLGRKVYEMCDGKTPVRKIVKKFADKHNISIAEAEVSVTKYLETMLSKGLVGMELDKDSL